jgi:anaerobic magnesium-protoporphyrin IX monomethyl ester cyclase
MRVLLIYPPVLHERVHQDEVAVPPLGIYSVGAVLREQGHEAEIWNASETKARPESLESVVDGFRPDVVGFSVLHANRWGAVDMARVVKRVDPRVRVVFGGIGATFLWEQLLANVPALDCIVLGEGELSFLDLVRHFEAHPGPGEGPPPERIPGIAFRKEGRPVRSPDRPLVQDLDSLPNPARYFTYRHVASTRGCTRNCSFCGSPRFWGRSVRALSPARFVEELELLHGRGVSFFYVSDDTFTADRDRVVEICRRILARGLRISWFAIARVDHVDAEMLRWMRRAGCIQVSYGVESGSEAVRRSLGKRLRPERIRRAFSLTTRAGILARAYFIYGCPGETDETIRETLDLIREIRPLGAIFYILDVFPGTALCERMERAGRLSESAWLERIEGVPYFELDSGISSDNVLAWGRRLRDGYHRLLGGFAGQADLSDDEEMRPLNADFCSRLAMTFSHGDYARIEAVPDPEGTAETLYRRSLNYFPDHRAFLGLAVLHQKRGEHREAARLLEEGVGSFPESEPLSLCLGISLMNLGRLEEALALFDRFPGSREAEGYADQCRRLQAGPASPPP